MGGDKSWKNQEIAKMSVVATLNTLPPDVFSVAQDPHKYMHGEM